MNEWHHLIEKNRMLLKDYVLTVLFRQNIAYRVNNFYSIQNKQINFKAISQGIKLIIKSVQVIR